MLGAVLYRQNEKETPLVADTAGDILIDVLSEWSVEIIVGMPGDGINGVMEALRKRQEDIRFIQVRHEESAAFMAWGMRNITVSGTLASMACGQTYVIAGGLAYPDRQVVAFVGDGGFSMLMADFVTAVKYRLPIELIVMDNGTLGQIKWEQMVFLGNPEFGCELAPIDYSAFAEACGARAFRVEDPKSCGDVLEKALAAEGTVLVQAKVDPHKPPLPPKISLDQARHFAESLARGTPNRVDIAATVLSGKVRELI